MGDKIKRYKIRDTNIDIASQVKLPQFYLEVSVNEIFETGTGLTLLNQEVLLKDFRLGDEDAKIDFDSVSSDLYKVDIQENRKDEYTPSFTKIENQLAKDSLVEYILSKPKESQVKDITYQIMHDRRNVSYS